MSQKPIATFRAQARCKCDWKGEHRAGTKREPHGSQAHADAKQHRETTGHTDTSVEAGWVGTCRGCGVRSERYQRAPSAWAWIEQHITSDPKHLRRQQEQQELSATADRILGAIRF